ncbi:hypothetical protein UFOVP111_1 [uncultured Caudovirales phage]|uniref:Uncharacterized protein n=1 Tax=uncultured Caudovirales phage TaxID=2100421 RepID=A0A6J5KZP7_9CAUD|nr:hypothetical protein UFOVP111_1 [uncultured Caudovirales phage]
MKITKKPCETCDTCGTVYEVEVINKNKKTNQLISHFTNRFRTKAECVAWAIYMKLP